jgi:hypothetical protein
MRRYCEIDVEIETFEDGKIETRPPRAPVGTIKTSLLFHREDVVSVSIGSHRADSLWTMSLLFGKEIVVCSLGIARNIAHCAISIAME